MTSKHAKLYLEEGSYLSIVSQNDAGGPQLHQGMSTWCLKKGGLVYMTGMMRGCRVDLGVPYGCRYEKPCKFDEIWVIP